MHTWPCHKFDFDDENNNCNDRPLDLLKPTTWLQTSSNNPDRLNPSAQRPEEHPATSSPQTQNDSLWALAPAHCHSFWPSQEAERSRRRAEEALPTSGSHYYCCYCCCYCCCYYYYYYYYFFCYYYSCCGPERYLQIETDRCNYRQQSCCCCCCSCLCCRY